MSADTEFAWVIEAVGPSGPIYWDGTALDAGGFRDDHSWAVRFSREIDAYRVHDRMLMSEARRMSTVRQHGWLIETKVKP